MSDSQPSQPVIERAAEPCKHAAYLREQGRLAEAEARCAQSLAFLDSQARADRLKWLEFLAELASLSEARGEYDAAAEAARRALDLPLPPGSEAASARQVAWAVLGAVHRQAGRYDEAETALRTALAEALETFGEAGPETAEARNNLGVLYKDTGAFAEAEALYRAALDSLEARYGRGHPATATLYHNLGGLAHARERFAEGEPWRAAPGRSTAST